jgi:hypothetical protein
MDRKRMSLTVISTAVMFLAITFITANSSTSNAPLYAFRMEQMSDRMNFLPTERNNFAYTAEKGYNLDYDVLGCCIGVEPLGTWPGGTCWIDTCPNTCWPNTCSETCSTCEGPLCKPTVGNTCWTCPNYTCHACVP